jgi:hypothetical protein
MNDFHNKNQIDTPALFKKAPWFCACTLGPRPPNRHFCDDYHIFWRGAAPQSTGRGELSHESDLGFDPCVRHHCRERHFLSGSGQAAHDYLPQAARDCCAGGTVHRPQLPAARPAHEAQTGAPADPSAGLVMEVRPSGGTGLFSGGDTWACLGG